MPYFNLVLDENAFRKLLFTLLSHAEMTDVEVADMEMDHYRKSQIVSMIYRIIKEHNRCSKNLPD